MKNIKRIMACILVGINLFSITSCGTGMEKLESEKQALQQQIEAVEKENSSIQANKEKLESEKQALQQQIEALEKENSSIQSSIQTDKENLQNQMDVINNAPQLIEEYQEIVERQELYGAPLEAGFRFADMDCFYGKAKVSTAVKADRSVFDINDVRLTVYWGADFAEEDVEELSCEAYSIGCDGGLGVVFAYIKEDLYTEENRAEVTFNNGFIEVKYKRSMEVVIPAKEFDRDEGQFYIGLRGYYKDRITTISAARATLCYYKSEDGTKVYLYNHLSF